VTCKGTRKEAEKAIIKKTIIVKEERLGSAFLPPCNTISYTLEVQIDQCKEKVELLSPPPTVRRKNKSRRRSPSKLRFGSLLHRYR
jgi:hypothetical protein